MDKKKIRKNSILVLFLLALLAIIINIIALVVITSRLFHGLTPNRIAVIVTNILVFVNLVIISGRLFRCYYRGASIELVERSVGKYLFVYVLWIVVAVFVLPLVFGFI